VGEGRGSEGKQTELGRQQAAQLLFSLNEFITHTKIGTYVNTTEEHKRTYGLIPQLVPHCVYETDFPF
jgi:hypothetical protein